MPATVAPEGFEAEEGFVAGAAPELARALEAALALAAGGFDGAAVERFAAEAACPIVHPRLMFVEVVHLGLRGCTRRAGRQGGEQVLKLADHFQRRLVFQLPHERLEPRFQFGLIFAPHGAAAGGEMLRGVIKIEPLAGGGKAVVGQAPDPDRADGDDEGTRGLA